MKATPMKEKKQEKQSDDAKKYDVFISYSRKNKDTVQPIKECLELQGFSCWMDLEGIESGSREFSEHIINAIDASSTMLFFLSAESQESSWALKEIDCATDEHKHVDIVRFNDDQMTKKFRFDFKRADIIDWRIAEQRGKLLRDLKNWVGQRKPFSDQVCPVPVVCPVEIYVGNLSYDMTEDQLRKEFEAFGTVNSARLFINKHTGKSKGFGLLRMPNRKEAEKALSALNDKEILGRRMKCKDVKNLI